MLSVHNLRCQAIKLKISEKNLIVPSIIVSCSFRQLEVIPGTS